MVVSPSIIRKPVRIQRAPSWSMTSCRSCRTKTRSPMRPTPTPVMSTNSSASPDGSGANESSLSGAAEGLGVTVAIGSAVGSGNAPAAANVPSKMSDPSSTVTTSEASTGDPLAPSTATSNESPFGGWPMRTDGGPGQPWHEVVALLPSSVIVPSVESTPASYWMERVKPAPGPAKSTSASWRPWTSTRYVPSVPGTCPNSTAVKSAPAGASSAGSSALAGSPACSCARTGAMPRATRRTTVDTRMSPREACMRTLPVDLTLGDDGAPGSASFHGGEIPPGTPTSPSDASRRGRGHRHGWRRHCCRRSCLAPLEVKPAGADRVERA